MKQFQIRTVIENRSRHPVAAVWENAQDLEHVAFLHRHTNRGFRLLHHERAPGSPNAYDTLIYSATRKAAGLIPLHTFGFRKIVGPYNIHQFESIAQLGWTSILNSQLVETGDAEFPTLMRDEVIVDLPVVFRPLAKWIENSLRKHATVQCAEDEPFRARRQELAKREIHLPFKLFATSEYTNFKARL